MIFWKETAKNLAGFRTIAKYLIPYKRKIIFLSVLSVFSAVASAFIPYLAGKLVDSIIAPGHYVKLPYIALPAFVFFVSIWFLIKIIGDAFDWQITLNKDRLSAVFESDFLVKCYQYLIELPLSFHKKRKMGEVLDKLSRSAGWLERIIGITVSIVPQFLSIIIALVITFLVKSFLAAILIVAVIAYAAILLKIAPASAVIQRKMHRAYNKAYGDAYDTVLNVQSVKQATAENYEGKKLYSNFLLKAVRLWNEL